MEIAIVWLSALLTGCAGTSDRHFMSSGFLDDRGDDSWWLGGKADRLFPRQWYFVGVGTCGPEVSEGERMDCAIHRALGQAVAMVRQDVRVDIHRHAEFDQKAGEGGFAARTSSTYRSDGFGQAELLVDDVAPRRRTCTSDGKCHALVALDRKVLSARSMQKLAHLKAQIDELLDRAENSDAIAAIEQISMATRLATSGAREAELLSAVAGPAAVPPSPWKRLAAVRNKRLESLVVCLSSTLLEPPAQLVFSSAHQDLSTRGFARVAITKELDCPEASISVSFQGATHERVAEDRLWVREIRGMLVLRPDVHALGKGVPVLGRGVAHVRDRARSLAEEDLAASVRGALAQLLDPTGASAQ